MTPERKRSNGVTIWMNEKEHAKVQALVGEKPTGEALRDYLLEQATRTPLDEMLMAEVIVTRDVIVNSLYTVTGKKLDADSAKELLKNSRANVSERARKALSGAE